MGHRVALELTLRSRLVAREQFGEPVDEDAGFRTQVSIWLIGNKNENRIRYPVAQDGFECAALNVRCGGKRQRMDDAETGQARPARYLSKGSYSAREEDVATLANRCGVAARFGI
jgi:hypothetical protein